eukprot:2980010-Amphidinium_carterae.1
MFRVLLFKGLRVGSSQGLRVQTFQCLNALGQTYYKLSGSEGLTLLRSQMLWVLRFNVSGGVRVVWFYGGE